MDKEYVLWGLKALGNNLCKSCSLKAGGDAFSAVSLSGWCRPAWCGPKSPRGTRACNQLGPGRVCQGLGRYQTDKEQCASQEMPLLAHPCRQESWSQGTTAPCSPRLPWDEGRSFRQRPCRGTRGRDGRMESPRALMSQRREPALAGPSMLPAASLLQTSIPPALWLKMSFEC